MAVIVLGKRFDIRVIEETSFQPEVDHRWIYGCKDWQEDHSSRASADGVSFYAAAEGLSETGSDADVSESCQVLLGLEAHGGSGTVT
ncbi:hypothetical protein A2U01_0061702, partial [Trifolium medium]|nr:hypothetical protein [Trifolium medium]